MQERSQEGQKRDFITHEQAIVCRQLFPVHVVGSQLMKWKKNLQQKITFEFPDKKKMLATNRGSIRLGTNVTSHAKTYTNGFLLKCSFIEWLRMNGLLSFLNG